MNRVTQLTTELYFTTDTVIDWVDIFTRPCYKHLVIESLSYCQKEKGLIIYAWVLMSNHLHMIVGTSGKSPLFDIIRDYKKYTSKAIIRELQENIQESRKKWMLNLFEFAGRQDKKNKNYKFWQEGNDAQFIYSTDYLNQKLNYIHENPVIAEIVSVPEEYLYSSAIDYSGGKGLLNITLIE